MRASDYIDVIYTDKGALYSQYLGKETIYGYFSASEIYFKELNQELIVPNKTYRIPFPDKNKIWILKRNGSYYLCTLPGYNPYNTCSLFPGQQIIYLNSRIVNFLNLPKNIPIEGISYSIKEFQSLIKK